MGRNDEPDVRSSRGSDFTTRTSSGVSSENKDIGPYRILELVGTGGMGEVYRAEQVHPIRRTVALKIIKLGMDTKEVMARFEAERQALALMDHPNIARVFEAGSTPRGRPYFAMEYVKGIRITTYCDEHKLSVRERLELFIQLCEGAQHAHQKAIIHRDLKPSNVLVTIQENTPVPKIIDFGVAKATAQKLTEKTMYTALGEMIGTPDYMSPEQATMTGEDIDTRTDVYALGVILYELLAGALPFEPTELRKAGFEGIVRMIREKDPPRPSTRVSTLADGGAEAAKARRTVPQKLRSRLRGDLDWIVMKALEKNRTRRYGSATELAADLRRHLRNEPVLASPPSATYRARKFVRRNKLGVSIAGALALLLAAFLVTITRERDRANLQAERANSEAKAARAVTEFLVNSFELVDPMDVRGDSITAREVLELGAQRIDHELVDQPILRAQIMDAIGRVYEGLDRDDRAEELLKEALRIRLSELGEWHPDTARSMSRLGGFYVWHGKQADGLALLKQALSIQEELLGDHVDTAWSLYALGNFELLARAPSDSFDVVSSFAEGRELLERARSIFESPTISDARGASWCWQDLGVGYATLLCDYANALPCFQRADEIKKTILPRGHADLAISRHAVGWTLYFLGDYERARPYLEEALEIYMKTVGLENRRTVNALHSLGETLVQMGEYAKGRRYLERALDVAQNSPRLQSEYLFTEILHSLGTVAFMTEQYTEAESLFRRTLQSRERIQARGCYEIGEWAQSLEDLAGLLRRIGRDAEAAPLEERAEEIRARLIPQRTTN